MYLKSSVNNLQSKIGKACFKVLWVLHHLYLYVVFSRDGEQMDSADRHLSAGDFASSFIGLYEQHRLFFVLQKHPKPKDQDCLSILHKTTRKKHRKNMCLLNDAVTWQDSSINLPLGCLLKSNKRPAHQLVVLNDSRRSFKFPSPWNKAQRIYIFSGYFWTTLWSLPLTLQTVWEQSCILWPVSAPKGSYHQGHSLL